MQSVSRAVRDLGSRTAVADFLGLPVATVEFWIAGAAVPSAAQEWRLAQLHAVMERLRTVPPGRLPPGWLRRPCPGLDGALPEDVVAVDGASRVLEALERELAGG